jgi:hypothetical protein
MRRETLAKSRPPEAKSGRKGVTSLDYVLVLGVVLPLASFILWIGPRIIRSAYEMVCVLVSWPFM